MWSLGDKIASSIVAQTAGVPTMPWSGSGKGLISSAMPSMYLTLFALIEASCADFYEYQSF